MPPKKIAAKKKKSGRIPTRTSQTGDPQFGQPAPSPDPTGFRTPVTDTGDFSKVNATLLQPVPAVKRRGDRARSYTGGGLRKWGRR